MFAILDCNNFFASCERVFNPRLYQYPVIVLSNNDGCVIARSEEARALGIKMAGPFHEIKDLCETHNVQVFSSNFPLYGDMSNRVMTLIESHWPDIEIYSIDEMFLDLRRCPEQARLSMCHYLQQHILQCTGIQVSIGVGPTKTLAKLANHIAKRKLRQTVFDISPQLEQVKWLPQVAIDEVWGVGKRLAKHLQVLGITTAMQLRITPQKMIRQHFGVMLERIAQELNGRTCLNIEAITPKQNIVSSRSFGVLQTELQPITEALSTYTVRAAEKLRKQGSVACGIGVFLRTNPFRKNLSQYNRTLYYTLPQPSADTRTLIQQAKHCLNQLYRPGYQYHKVGVMLLDLQPHHIEQCDLFIGSSVRQQQRAQQLMQTLDRINQRFGRDTLKLAAQGMTSHWQMRARLKSPAYTTQWSDLPKAR